MSQIAEKSHWCPLLCILKAWGGKESAAASSAKVQRWRFSDSHVDEAVWAEDGQKTVQVKKKATWISYLSEVLQQFKLQRGVGRGETRREEKGEKG